MARPLDKYREMRDFKATPEPAGSTWRGTRTTARKARGPIFVVQRHEARRLHFDFRLEHEGVLLSWAVPKGPSTSVGERRLAVRTEDHPIEYASFEGDIPQGEYGAGHVDIWDRGTWAPVGDAAEGLRTGHLKFDLDGEKLAGRFVLIRLKPRDGERQESWLLIHERTPAADAPAGVPPAKAKRTGAKSRAAAPRPRAKRKGTDDMPSSVAPQLATSAAALPGGDGWRYEIKFDGYRLLARIEDGTVRLFTRNGLDWSGRFPTIAAALARLPVDHAWIDGEAIALDEHGRSSFGKLQKSLERGAPDALRYAAFDLLFVDGEDLRARPLDERQARLAQVLGAKPPAGVVLSQTLRGDADALLAEACRLKLEGLIAKRADAAYQSRRSRDWLKLKCRPRDEFVIGGYTAGQGSRVGLGALLLGAYDGGRLVYCGRVGTGLDDTLLKSMAARLAKIEQAQAPFASVPRDQLRKFEAPRWVKPLLVAEIEYAELTPQGLIRQGSFVGLREDKTATSVTVPPPAGAIAPAAAPAKAPAAARKAAAPAAPALKRASPARKADDAARVAGVAISNPARPVPGHDDLTKLDLVRYYEAVAPWLLGEIGKRPLSLVRCPGADFRHCYFQRHPETGKGNEKDESIPYVRVRTVKELIASVQGGTIEFHEWGATLPRIDRPDRITLDLDPDPALSWDGFREACELTRALLDELELRWFVKTTGGKGLHFVLPIVRRDGWDEVKAFAQQIAEHLARTLPALFIANMSKAKRSGKVFVDYLRNGETATAVAAYSLRSRPGLPVAMPVAWDELDRDVRGDHFNVRNVPAFLADREDPWAGYAEAAQSIAKAKRRLG
ncbi:MAG TPA: DNA ligase D [Casimicrobiaceae bacterium]|nr:DNA ligase D [Casimicrobiaceae bacterium]